MVPFGIILDFEKSILYVQEKSTSGFLTAGWPRKSLCIKCDLYYKKYISKQPIHVKRRLNSITYCEIAHDLVATIVSFGISIHKTRKNHVRYIKHTLQEN